MERKHKKWCKIDEWRNKYGSVSLLDICMWAD